MSDEPQHEPGLPDHFSRDQTNASPPEQTLEQQERVERLSDAIADLLYSHNQSLADRHFERIEKRIADLVGEAAKHVVPKNIRGLIETVIVLRTARLQDEIRGLRTVLEQAERRLSAEIARTIEAPFPDPAPEPKVRKRRKKRVLSSRRK